jgi:CubicO group peptidase (beta-lactamase class C family)
MGGSLAFAGTDAPIYDIPLVQDIKIDGDASDWSDSGFAVEVMTDEEGNFRSARDFGPRLRLAWDERGLLALAEVRDSRADEHDYIRHLFKKDSIEYFVASQYGAPDYYMLVIAPGVDAKYGKPRHIFFDHRNFEAARYDVSSRLKVSTATRKIPGGYCVETLMPWSNLGLDPKVGNQVAFQVYMMDSDGGARCDYVTWHPGHDTHLNRTTSMYPLRLAKAASPPVTTAVRSKWRHLHVATDRARAGQKLGVRHRGVELAQGTLEDAGQYARASMALPEFAEEGGRQRLEVVLDGQTVAWVPYVSRASMLTWAIHQGQLDSYRYVFSGRRFPKVCLRNEKRFNELIGGGRVEATYYDSALQEVTVAERPGRYGMVVKILPKYGRPTQRFITLYRAPDEAAVPRGALPYWISADVYSKLDSSITPGVSVDMQAQTNPLPEAKFGARAGVVFAGRQELGTELSGNGHDAGAMLAYQQADRAWWIRFKRKMDGATGPGAVVAPKQTRSASPVLREGTCEEAGVDPKVVDRLDELCREFAAASEGNGFTICVARRGVVFFHRAYGMDGEKPMTIDRPSPVYSVTKIFTSALAMMYVDQGMLDLDTPIENYLPVLRDIRIPKPITIRHLLSHTSGLRVPRGLDRVDLPQIVAEEYAFAEVGSDWHYSNVGCALTAEIMERLSGRPYPDLLSQSLFKPLGCEHSTTRDPCGGLLATAGDLARLGQLLLNRGTYGNQRFFSAELADGMRPHRLTELLGEDTTRIWGLGVSGVHTGVYRPENGFGKGGQNSSNLRVIPRLGIVFTFANTGDRKYLSEELYDRFLDALNDAVPQTEQIQP